MYKTSFRVVMEKSNWKPVKKKLTALDVVNDVLFVLAYTAAFAAGIRQIDVAKKASSANTPQNPEVVGLILAVKLCKLPKTLTTFYRQHNFYNGVLAFGVFVAASIWSVALYYALK